MTDSDNLHTQSMALVDAALEATRSGHRALAQWKFLQAATLEERAADVAPGHSARTMGILYVSATSLYLNAGQLERAKDLVQRIRFLVAPGFTQELEDLLSGTTKEPM